MIKSRSSAGFALKPLHRMVIAGEVIRQEFESDLAAELGVFSLIDNAHAATAQFLQDAVMGNRLADHREATCASARILGRAYERVNLGKPTHAPDVLANRPARPSPHFRRR